MFEKLSLDSEPAIRICDELVEVVDGRDDFEV